MLRGVGTPLLENKKVSWLLGFLVFGVWFIGLSVPVGFLVSWFLVSCFFLVYWCLGFEDSKIL